MMTAGKQKAQLYVEVVPFIKCYYGRNSVFEQNNPALHNA